MGVTHKAKAGALLTGTEYEAADAHTTDTDYTFSNGVKVVTGTGDPEGSVTAPAGSLYLDTGAASSTGGSPGKSVRRRIQAQPAPEPVVDDDWITLIL